MSIDRYKSLQPGRVSEFEWEVTTDQQIIIRERSIGEIFAVIDRPLSLREAIAAGYHEGLITGHSASSRYIEFLEQLTAPIMPDFVPESMDYNAADFERNAGEDGLHQFKNADGGQGYVIDACLPVGLVDDIARICQLTKLKHFETYYATAAAEYVETAGLKTDPILAVPNAGTPIQIFVSSDTFDIYKSYALFRGYSINSLLVTAITNITQRMNRSLLTDDASHDPSETPTHCFGQRLEAAE